MNISEDREGRLTERYEMEKRERDGEWGKGRK